MKTKNSWLILTSTIVILILTTFIFSINQSKPSLDTQPETSLGDEQHLSSAYPRNLIEGVITLTEINSSEGEIKVKVNLNKILQEEDSSDREVTVLINKNTEFTFFELETQIETQMKAEDFKKEDQVLIAIEGENTEILTQDTFVGVWVKKMIIPPVE